MNISIFDIMESMEILHSKRMTDYSKYKNFHILHNAEYGHLKSSIFDIQKIETSIFYVMKHMEIYPFIVDKSKNRVFDMHNI